MIDAKTSCTCRDRACPLHPANHEQGCAMCIRKCLHGKEIPSRFFRDIDHPKPAQDWH